MKTIIPALFCWLTACLVSPTVMAADSTLIDFEIKDQFDGIHRDDDFRGRVVVVFAYDRKGNDYQDRWFSAMRDSLAVTHDSSAVGFVRLANVRGVPFFLKSMIKGKFPREPEQWTLLDWKGRFDKAYGFAADMCTILVFNQRRTLVHSTTVTGLAAETLTGLLADVRRLLPAK
jgi:hypothetical protein